MESDSLELPDREQKNKMSDWQEISGQRDAGPNIDVQWIYSFLGLVNEVNVSPNILLPCKGRSRLFFPAWRGPDHFLL